MRLRRRVPQPLLLEVEGVQVIDEERVLDGFEDDADVLRVRGAGEVWVHGFVAPAMKLLVQLQDELLGGIGVTLRPCGDQKKYSFWGTIILF